ncbi:MAG: hypothetical protein OXG97_20330 [Candidatus Poribacteria bacterium]|nr:hypothetical protein [Candidatus Poribacteria bacterium]
MNILVVSPQKNVIRMTVFLLILGFTLPMMGPVVQEAEACDAARVICTGAFAAATAYCGKADTEWWECAAAMASASAICAAAWALCGSS